VGARCGSSARRVLCGGRADPVELRPVPTATAHAHPLGKDPLGEVACLLRHPAPAASRTEAAALTGEAGHAHQAALFALEAGAAGGEHAALEIAAELVDDEAWQRSAEPFALGEEVGQVLAQDRVQRPSPRVERARIDPGLSARGQGAGGPRRRRRADIRRS